jgi:hypothetical protein
MSGILIDEQRSPLRLRLRFNGQVTFVRDDKRRGYQNGTWFTYTNINAVLVTGINLNIFDTDVKISMKEIAASFLLAIILCGANYIKKC